MTTTLERPAENTHTAVTSVFAKSLAKALATATLASGSSNVLDWTRMVRLECVEGKIKLACTDMKWQIATFAKTIGPHDSWAVTADARKLHDLVASFPGDAQVKLCLRGTSLVVECGRSTTKFPTGDAEVFPLMPTTHHSILTAPAVHWAKGIAYTEWAASSPNNPTHNAIQFEFDHNPDMPDAGIVSATDGNCAAVWNGMDIRVMLNEGGKASFRLPADTLRDFARLLKGAEDLTVNCWLMGGNAERPAHAVFGLPDKDDQPDEPHRTTVAIRCLEGVIYPLANTLEKIEATAMTPDGGTLVTDPAGMASALRRVLIMGQSGVSGYTPVSITMGTDTARMQVRGQGVGEGVDDIDINPDTSVGASTVILAANYLKGALEACQEAGGDVSVRYVTPMSPAVFSPAGDDTLSVMVMPMEPNGGSK